MLKNIKKFMFWFAILFSVGALTVQAPVFGFTFGEKMYAIFMAIGVCWWAVLHQLDWDYVTRHTDWSVAAGKCPNQNLLQKVVDTGIVRDGKPVIIDIRQAKKEGVKFGRWTVFYDQSSGVRLYRDESKFKDCWYYMH